jgi:pyridoxamine 5'-phosphate oxidase
MTIQEVIRAISEKPVFYLATIDGDMPRVRGMLLYKATEHEILFHTAKCRDLYTQIVKNPNAELCFNNGNNQIRISGKLEVVEDHDLKDEIAAAPTRAFLKPWLASVSKEDFYREFAVLRMTKGKITVWNFEHNLEPKEELDF